MLACDNGNLCGTSTTASQLGSAEKEQNETNYRTCIFKQLSQLAQLLPQKPQSRN